MKKHVYHEAQSIALLDLPKDTAAVTEAILKTAAECGKEPKEEKHTSGDSDRIKRLRKARDEAATKEDRKLKSICLSKALRQQLREKRNRHLEELIEKGAGNKLPQIHKYFKKDRRIAGIRDNAGIIRTGRGEIAEVFASFYQSLYSAPREAVGEAQRRHRITAEELRDDVVYCIKKLKRKRACADDGLVAEMLKDGGTAMVDAISDVFAGLLNGEARAPESWNVSKIVVLFKKGEVTLPKKLQANCHSTSIE